MKILTLETKNHTSGIRSKDYAQLQIDRHAEKVNVKQTKSAYEIVADGIKKHFLGIENKKQEMLCLGTRNNHERDCFASFFPSFIVKSVDISPLAKADYTLDFTSLPQEWQDRWDIIYSNSIDHSNESTKTLDEWIRCLKSGGIIALGFSYGHETSNTDICSFTEENVHKFLKNKETIKIVENLPGEAKDASTWILQKI
jgi:hypothetical protein